MTSPSAEPASVASGRSRWVGRVVVIALGVLALTFVGLLKLVGDPRQPLRLDPYTGQPVDMEMALSRQRVDPEPKEETRARRARRIALDAELAVLAQEGGQESLRYGELLVERGLLRLAAGDRTGARQDLAQAERRGADGSTLRNQLEEPRR